MSKKEVILIIFVCLVIGGFIGVLVMRGYQDNKTNQQQKEQDIFTNGTIYGTQYTLYQIVSLATQCKEVPIPYGNQTYNLIWEECLKK